MIQQGYDLLVTKIVTATNLQRSEVEGKIEQKLKELQDLISREGAAHIVANELKVQLFDNAPKVLKIKDVSVGMNAVTVTGRVVSVFEPRSFTTAQRTGRVLNLTIGDETGSVKVVVWDENVINSLSKLKQGDILKVKNGYVKVNNAANEVHVGNRSQVQINPENETVGEVKVIDSGNIKPAAKRRQVKDFVENEVVEVVGNIVGIFEPKFYNACPVCNKKVFPQGEAFQCQEHGVVSAKQVPILNVFFDDGTAVVRAVCFRDQAEKLIAGKAFEEVKNNVLGKQVVMRGRVTKNAMFDRMEFVVSGIEDADPAKLIAEMENVR